MGALNGRTNPSNGTSERKETDMLASVKSLYDLAWRGVAKSLVPALMRTGRAEEARHLASRALRLTHAFARPHGIADASRASALAHTDGPEIEQLRAAAAIYEAIARSRNWRGPSLTSAPHCVVSVNGVVAPPHDVFKRTLQKIRLVGQDLSL